jgi:hypothetical protein
MPKLAPEKAPVVIRPGPRNQPAATLESAGFATAPRSVRTHFWTQASFGWIVTTGIYDIFS